MLGISIVYHFNRYSKIEHIESILSKIKILKQSNKELKFNINIVGIKENLDQTIVKKISQLNQKEYLDFNDGLNTLICDNKYKDNLYLLYKEVYEKHKLLNKVLFLNGNVKNLINIISYLFVTPSDIVDYKLVDSTTRLVKYDGYSIISNKNGVKTIAIDNLDTRVVDKYNPIKDAVEQLAQGKPVETVFDAYKLARNANDAKAKALYSLKYGTFDFNTMKRNGEGLNEALSTVGKNEMKMFDAFLAANRAVELNARGIQDTGFDIDHAKNLVAKAPAHFAEAAKNVN